MTILLQDQALLVEVLAGTTELSSRPERSGVKGPAVQANHPTSLTTGNTLITINEGYSFHVEGLWKKVDQVDRLHGIIKS
jgi:hypothetical protein